MNLSSLRASLTSTKTLLAIVVSAAVTAVVAGPLAQQAFEARDALAETRETESERNQGDDGGRRPEELAAPPPTSSVSTTTTPPSVSAGGVTPTTMDEPSATSPRRTTTTVRRTTTTAPTRPTTTTAPGPGPVAPPILVSVSPDGTLSNPMDGTEVSGSVWVFVEGVALTQTSWELDGLPLIPGVPLNTALLTPGEHRIEVEVQTATGTVTGLAVFTVVR